jgi:hypothetical protein
MLQESKTAEISFCSLEPQGHPVSDIPIIVGFTAIRTIGDYMKRWGFSYPTKTCKEGL